MKTFFSVLFSFACFYTLAQPDIIQDCTDLSGECLYYPSEQIVVANEKATTGFTISADLTDKNGNLQIDGFICNLYNIGACCEKNQLTLMFEDNSIITLLSWNDFNCDGNAYFNITKAQLDKLCTLKIIKAQIKNGYSFDSFQNSISASQQDYFITISNDIKNNKIKTIK